MLQRGGEGGEKGDGGGERQKRGSHRERRRRRSVVTERLPDVPPRRRCNRTCVLLHSGEGLLEGVGGGGALGGVGRQAVGVHGLHRGVSVGLMGDAGEPVDDGRDEAGHGGGGDVGWRRAEACWEKTTTNDVCGSRRRVPSARHHTKQS